MAVGYFLPLTQESKVAADIPKHRAASSIPYRGTSRRSIVLRSCTAPPFKDLVTVLSIISLVRASLSDLNLVATIPLYTIIQFAECRTPRPRQNPPATPSPESTPTPVGATSASSLSSAPAPTA